MSARNFITSVLMMCCLAGTAQQSDSTGENIYLHYDKPYYAAGETVWFKAYIFKNGLPSTSAHNLYLEMSDKSGKVVLSQKYPVANASAKGSISLSDTLTEGYYTLRVVTPGLQPEDFLYKKNLYVFKTGKLKHDSVAVKNIKMNFYPESGNLIDSIYMQVGFKATDANGNPVNISGVIRASNDAVMTQFKTLHAGIGKFAFKPKSAQKYFAEAEVNGKTYSFPIPTVQPTGINLKVSDEAKGKVYEISRNYKTNPGSLKLIVQLNGQSVFEMPFQFEGELMLRGHLATNDLPSGILSFIIYNSQNQPLAERVSFVNNKEYIRSAEINPDKINVTRRALNTITVNIPAEIQTGCSLAVVEESANNFPDRENIYSRLMLNNDLRGYVYDAGWYFNTSESTAQEALDNLMITSRSNRYNTSSQLVNPASADNYLITVKGQVKNAKTGKVFSGGKIDFIIASQDSTTQQVSVPVNASGNFILDSLLIFGKAELYYSYKNAATAQESAEIIPQVIYDTIRFPANKADSNIYAVPFYTTVYNSIAASAPDNITHLPEVIVQSNKKQRPSDEINNRYTSSIFRSSGKIIIDNINHPYTEASLSVLDYIKANFPNLMVTSSGIVSRKNFSLGSGAMWRVEPLIDEAATSLSALGAMRMREVALIKLYEAGFAGVGSNAPGGAVAVYTKKPEDGSPVAVPENMKHFTIEGYTATKDFFNPDYSSAGPFPAHDNRITLYWNPDISTAPENHVVQLKFYNNDFSKKLHITLEGIDNTGKMIHVERIIGE